MKTISTFLLLAGILGTPLSAETSEINIFELEEVDTLPVPIEQEVPIFPECAEEGRIGAEIVVHFIITEAGIVEDMRIISEKFFYTEGPLREITKRIKKSFRSNVLDGVAKWTFKPATYQGESVPCRVRLVIPSIPEVEDSEPVAGGDGAR